MGGTMQAAELLTLAEKMRRSAAETRHGTYAGLFLAAAAELELRANQLALGQIQPGARAGSLDVAC
jgi:hypothetical protein